LCVSFISLVTKLVHQATENWVFPRFQKGAEWIWISCYNVMVIYGMNRQAMMRWSAIWLFTYANIMCEVTTHL